MNRVTEAARPWVAGVLCAGAFAAAAACSSTGDGSTPTTQATPGLDGGSSETGAARDFCDDYAAKIVTRKCEGAPDTASIAAACRQGMGGAAECAAEYETALDCHTANGKCAADGSLDVSACASQAEAFAMCSGANQEDGGNSACNTLDEPTIVTLTANPATPPAPAGGEIEDGTYDLTAAVFYGFDTVPSNIDSTGRTYRFKKNADGSYAVDKIVIDPPKTESERATQTWTVLGADVTSTASCGFTESTGTKFTFDGNGLRLYGPFSGGGIEYVFEKR